MEEKKFPIYRILVHWNQVDFQNNFADDYKMFPKMLTDEQRNKEIQLFKSEIVTGQVKKEKPVTEFLSESCEYIEDETWTMTWFSHYTLNKFETDQAALQSFDEYVTRKLRTRECLMGAEDSWRWKLCRCEFCTARGRITIDH